MAVMAIYRDGLITQTNQTAENHSKLMSVFQDCSKSKSRTIVVSVNEELNSGPLQAFIDVQCQNRGKNIGPAETKFGQ